MSIFGLLLWFLWIVLLGNFLLWLWAIRGWFLECIKRRQIKALNALDLRRRFR